MTITLPALIDCHVHFREPGFPEKGDMQSESASAMAGGVMTVCDMPNTSPPLTSVEALQDKVRRFRKLRVSPSTELRTGGQRSAFDMRFFFGVTEGSHLTALRSIFLGHNSVLRELRGYCVGVKLYFDHSTGNQGANMQVIEEAFTVCAKLDVPVVCHCEDPTTNAAALTREARSKKQEAIDSRILVHQSPVASHSLVRPPESEAKAVADAIRFSRKHGTHLHVAHISTREGVELVRQAKREGLRVTCEVAPHHLFLTVDDYATLGTFGKMNPPLRSRDHRDALWQGIFDRTIDCIATDHAPHTLAEKRASDWMHAPSGVPGVETMLPLLLTVAAGKWPHPTERLATGDLRLATGDWRLALNSQFSIPDIVRLCFTNPNRIFRLGKNPDDVSIEVDPDVEWTIRGADLHAKCGWTPYEGWKVQGKVLRVITPQ